MAAGDAVAAMRKLVHRLGADGRLATDEEAARLRQHFGQTVIPGRITARVTDKHGTHVEENHEWRPDTGPDDYLASLRAVVLDERGGIFCEYSDDEDDWTIYFVGRARRAWHGPASSGWIVVIFNADRGL